MCCKRGLKMYRKNNQEISGIAYFRICALNFTNFFCLLSQFSCCQSAFSVIRFGYKNKETLLLVKPAILQYGLFFFVANTDSNRY